MKIRYSIYILLCFILYILVALAISISPINMSNEDMLQLQISGMVIVLNYFATAYIRNILIYVLKIERKNNILDTSLNWSERIITFLSSILSTIIIYYFFSKKNISNEMKAIIPTLNFIFSWVVNAIATRNNRKCQLFDILKVQEKKIEPIFKPLIFVFVWEISVLMMYGLFKEKLSTLQYGIVGYIGLYIYALLISFVFSIYNKRHSLKVNDMDEYGFSKNAALFNIIFRYELFLAMLIVNIFILNNIIKVNHELISLFITQTSLINVFFLTAITMLFVKKISFSTQHTFDQNGKPYKEMIGYSDGPLNKSKEVEPEKNCDIGIKQTYYKNEFGNVVGKSTTVSHYGDFETTYYEDEFGNTVGKSTTYKK